MRRRVEFGPLQRPDTRGSCCRGCGHHVGDARAVRQDPLCRRYLFRGAGCGAGFGRVGRRSALRPCHRRREEPASLGERPGVSGPSGARGDRPLLFTLLLYGQGEHGRDGGDPALQLAGVRGGAGAVVPERGTERGEGARALTDHRWSLPRRRGLRPGEPGGEPEGAPDRTALGVDLRAVFDLRPSRGGPPWSFRHPELRPLLRDLSARRGRAPYARHAGWPLGGLLRPALHARGGPYDARVCALHLRARTPRRGEGGHIGHGRTSRGRRPRGRAACGGSYVPEGGRRITRDLRRGAGPAQASQGFWLVSTLPSGAFSTLRLTPSLLSPPPPSGRRLSALSKSSRSIAPSVEPVRRRQWHLVRGTESMEREELKAESESLQKLEAC